MWHSRDGSPSNTVQAMNCCDYCGKPATTQIPTIPGRVCEAHAQEFWTGLLDYVRKQHARPNVSLEAPCSVVVNDPSPVKLRLVAAKADIGCEPLRRAS